MPFLPPSQQRRSTEGCKKLSGGWWGGGMLICIGQGADVHMAQYYCLSLSLAPGPGNPDWFCFSFMVLTHPDNLDKIQRSIKW